LEAWAPGDTLAPAMKLPRLAPLLLLLLAPACSSPKTANAAADADKDPRASRSEPISDEDWNRVKPERPHGDPLAVRFTDFRSNLRLELVNESRIDPTEQYSQKKKAAESMTKVGHDEVVAALVERLESQGFFKFAQPGPAPAAGAGAWTMSLELERKDGLRHMAIGNASSAKEREVFGLCRTDFATLYNGILGLQSVERPPDWQSQKTGITPPKH
jgi:hypothetical protein